MIMSRFFGFYSFITRLTNRFDSKLTYYVLVFLFFVAVIGEVDSEKLGLTLGENMIRGFDDKCVAYKRKL